jgi:hypothetical protein
MTYAETITTLPPVQRDAVHALQSHPGDEDLIADAFHADVPVDVISYAGEVPVDRVPEITASHDAEEIELAEAIYSD